MVGVPGICHTHHPSLNLNLNCTCCQKLVAAHCCLLTKGWINVQWQLLWIFPLFRISWKQSRTYKLMAGRCSTPTQLLICSSFSREHDHPLLICSSRSTAQDVKRKKPKSCCSATLSLNCRKHSTVAGPDV